MNSKVIFIVLVISTSLFACKKEQSLLSNEEIANQIANQKEFTVYVKNTILNLGGIARLNSRNVETVEATDPLTFVPNTDDIALNTDSLNYEKSMIFKNNLDNQTLTLLYQNPTLIYMDSLVVEQIIRNAIDLKLAMTDYETLKMKEEVNIALNSGITVFNSEVSPLLPFGVILAEGEHQITIDEVWDCAKDALGVGAGTILSIAGIQKLAKEGIQKVVITLSKWLAKRAGWIGAAIVVIDFSSCVYAQSQD